MVNASLLCALCHRNLREAIMTVLDLIRMAGARWQLRPQPCLPCRPACIALVVCLGSLAACDRAPRQPPTTPKPPQPRMSAGGYPKSLLGNAILSSALLRYQVQCNTQKESVRICRIPQSGAPYRDAGDT
jgi:hypothetical protein